MALTRPPGAAVLAAPLTTGDGRHGAELGRQLSMRRSPGTPAALTVATPPRRGRRRPAAAVGAATTQDVLLRRRRVGTAGVAIPAPRHTALELDIAVAIAGRAPTSFPYKEGATAKTPVVIARVETGRHVVETRTGRQG